MPETSQPYDRSSKWLLDHHGAAILRLAGLTDLISCKTAAANLVMPVQLPDGLLEARLAGQPEPLLFIVEIATYPQRRVSEQILRNALLVLLDRRTLPEVVTLVLHPKGKYQVPDAESYSSKLGWTELQIRSRVVELWKMPAEPLLATGDVGLIPWVPLTQFDGPPEPVLRRCRERIDQAPPDERANLLVVTQILMRLRYNDPQFFAIFGGQQAMIESPLLDELRDLIELRTMHRAILKVLRSRLGDAPEDVKARLDRAQDPKVIEELLDAASTCQNFDDFRTKLPS